MVKTGILLVNLGTPDSPRPKDVMRYLNEFLTDGRVIDLPWFRRQCLVRGLIVPLRYRQSAALYRHLWTEEGSPLLVYGKAVQQELQKELGADFSVSLAMRYQNPSIKVGLEKLKNANVQQIVVFPLFPQYASATTGSVHQKVMDHVKHWTIIPKMTFVNSYADHPSLIQAFYERSQSYDLDDYDHILLSFHGLPEKHIRSGDISQTCLQKTCCQSLSTHNQFCYRAQCHATARALVRKLEISADRYTVCFQSRLGKEPWIQPYTSKVIEQCAKIGYKKLLVYCPSFVCDCLETVGEISEEYGQLFEKRGGECLALVEGLNTHPSWIKGLKTMILEHC